MTKDEWWLRAAVSDDRLVAELLLRLKDSSAAVMKPLPPSWGIRQPRSSVEKKKETPRRSPTTPLSFGGASGAASPSYGYEDSSGHHNEARPQPSDRFKSKISPSTEAPTTTSKRQRKKKTFAELKEEESSLLKERTYLKKELATLSLTLKERRSINENLKRMKLDLHVESRLKSEANSIEHEQRNTNQNGPSEAASSNASESNSCIPQDGLTAVEPIFVLPDLNMAPDNECGQEGIIGMC